MNFDFTSMGKLMGYTVGFIAGIYSLLFVRPSASDPFEFMLLWAWFTLIAASTIANAYGMLHQAELWHKCSDTPTKEESG